MFSSLSTLKVVPYTPKMPSTLTHKLPAKPSWSNSRKEPVKSLPASAETVEESERRKKPATVSGLMFGENPPFGTKIVLGVFNPTLPYHSPF
jgi:hypothetical protein